MAVGTRTLGIPAGGAIAAYYRYLQVDPIFYRPVLTAVTVGRVTVAPIELPLRVTLDRLCYVCGIAAGNVRLGIYADNAGLPDGGALLADTGSLAAVLNNDGKAIANIQLGPGLIWVAFQNDGALSAFVYQPFSPQGGTLTVRTFAQAYGAFPDPCPVTAEIVFVSESPYLFVRVASVP